jgi:hypothetical protein
LGKALQDARNGKGAGLLALADDHNGRDKKGRYTTSSGSKPIIDCASGIVNKGFKDPAKMLKTVKEKAPWYYRDAEKSWFEERDYCGKPFTDAKLISLNYSGTAPIVVIGGDKDPATPFRWAEKMSKNLKGSVLVKYTGEGHGTVGSNVCTSKIAVKVFVDKELPPAGKECGVDAPLTEPTWWASYAKSIQGESFSRFEFGEFFRLPLAEYFSEYLLVKGDVKRVREIALNGLRSRGLVVENPESTGVDETIWVVNTKNSSEFIGVQFVDEANLVLNELTGDSGPFSVGHTLVILYTHPLE